MPAAKKVRGMKVESSKSLQSALRSTTTTYVDLTWDQAGTGGQTVQMHLNTTLIVMHLDGDRYSIACGKATNAGMGTFNYTVPEGDYYSIVTLENRIDAIVLFADDTTPILVANVDEFNGNSVEGQEDDDMSAIYYEGGLDVPSIINDDENID